MSSSGALIEKSGPKWRGRQLERLDTTTRLPCDPAYREVCYRIGRPYAGRARALSGSSNACRLPPAIKVTPAVVKPGATIAVQWANITAPNPGNYFLMFDGAGQPTAIRRFVNCATTIGTAWHCGGQVLDHAADHHGAGQPIAFACFPAARPRPRRPLAISNIFPSATKAGGLYETISFCRAVFFALAIRPRRSRERLHRGGRIRAAETDLHVHAPGSITATTKMAFAWSGKRPRLAPTPTSPRRR